MKKLFTVALSLAIAVVMLFSFCACSSYGGIKDAFEDAGYTEIEPSESQKKQIETIVGEDYDSKVSFHVFQKDLNVAIIIEFKEDEDLVKALNKNVGEENVKEAYEALQKLDTVNENCTIVSVSPDALNIFKSTK